MIPLVTVAGGSSSGKTYLVEKIIETLDLPVLALSLDDYYKDVSGCKDIESYNFDSPDAIDLPRLSAHVACLVKGESIEIPEYDFVTHRRKGSKRVNPADYSLIVVEGLFALHYDFLHKLSQLKIYVDTPPDIRLLRRIKRDTVERGRAVHPLLNRYERFVRPMHNAYVEPSKERSDLVINGMEIGNCTIDKVRNMLEALL
jgi:uridine kinase